MQYILTLVFNDWHLDELKVSLDDKYIVHLSTRSSNDIKYHMIPINTSSIVLLFSVYIKPHLKRGYQVVSFSFAMEFWQIMKKRRRRIESIGR